MTNFALFTDVSLDPQRRLGVGGYLLVPVSYLESELSAIDQNEVFARLKSMRFADTSSTRLELPPACSDPAPAAFSSFEGRRSVR